MPSLYKFHFRECRYVTEVSSEFSLEIMRVITSVNKQYYSRYDPRNDNIYISRGRCRRTILQGRYLMYCCQRVKKSAYFFPEIQSYSPMHHFNIRQYWSYSHITDSGISELLLTSANSFILFHIILCYLYNSQNVRLHCSVR